jgi:hypothetical protein
MSFSPVMDNFKVYVNTSGAELNPSLADQLNIEKNQTSCMPFPQEI